MKWIAHLVQHPRKTWILALILLIPGLFTGYAMDDLWLLAQRTGPHLTSPSPAHDLYQLWPLPSGGEFEVERPWYADSTAKMSFMRPLASLSLSLDIALFPRAPIWGHIVNLAWYLALLIGITRLYRELLPNATVAGIAVLLYAIDDGRAMAITWICGRHLVMGVAFFVWAFWHHLQWRKTGDISSRLYALLLWVCALASSEGSAFLVAYVLCEELRHRRSFRQVASSLAPWLVVAFAWAIIYISQGHGTAGQDLYLSPWKETGRYAVTALFRVPALLLSEFFPVTADPLLFIERPVGQAALIGVAMLASVVAVVGLLLRFAGREKAIQSVHWLVALVACSGGLAASAAQDRTLLIVGIGGAAIMALALEPFVRAIHKPIDLGHRWFWKFLVISHIYLPLILLPARSAAHRQFALIYESAARSLERVPNLEKTTIVFLTSPGPLRGAFSGQLLRGLGYPAPANNLTLT